jgi:hypothetical protein
MAGLIYIYIYIYPRFLDLALVGMVSFAPLALNPGTHRMGCCVVDVEKTKFLIPPGLELGLLSRRVASHYTDCSIEKS